MKRFYCTICKKVKRVRQMPSNSRPNPERHGPKEHTLGTCVFHKGKS